MRVVSELTCYLGRILLYTIKTGPCIELHHFAVTLQTPVITFHKFENIVGSYARRFTVVVSNTFKHVPFTVNNFPVQPPCPNPKRSTGVIRELTSGNCGEVGFHLSQI